MGRKQELLQLLLEAQAPLTSAQLSSQLHVSSRTIRNDLYDMEALIRRHQVALKKKPRVGIWLEGKKADKEELFLDMADALPKPFTYSKQSRRAYMLIYLLLGRNRMYIAYFADMFYTSKATIEKDITAITDWLRLHHVVLKRQANQGLYVEGKELDIRNAFAIIVSSLQDIDGPYADVQSFLDVDMERLQNRLRRWALTHHLALSDANIHNIAFHIAIMIQRLHLHKTIALPDAADKEMQPWKQEQLMQDLEKLMEDFAKQPIPQAEANYIFLHLVGMSLDTNLSLAQDTMLMQLQAQAQRIAQEFIENIEQIVCLKKAARQALRQSLIQHLLPTIYRLKYGLNLYNPLLHEIKANYASAYTLASIINSSFQKELGVCAGEEEIAFIALHISLALENGQDTLTVAVVCPMGRGISRFLLVKLQESFPQVTFLNYAMKEISEEQGAIDMVISTVPLELDIPCITIRAILTPEDRRLIHAMMVQLANKTQRYFSLQTILMVKEKQEKNQILAALTQCLMRGHYVDESFYAGVLKREEMGSTEIGNGIVLTHGFHESVKRSQIAFCKLDTPLVWKEEPVWFIVLLAIERKDAQNVMRMDWLYKMLNNEKTMQEILQSQTEQELFALLCREYER